MPQESAKTPSTKASRPRKRTSKKTAKGLGDTVENLIPKKVKQVVEAVMGEDCGCNERKSWLNKKFPYFLPMNEQDQKTWVEELEPAMRKNVLTMAQQEMVIEMYERTYKKRHKKTKCGKCVLDRMVDLQKAYEATCES